MRINDEKILREMKKDPNKTKRVNRYNVKYLKFNGEYEDLTFNQGYDHSTDAYNPFFVRVYDSDGNYIMGGTNSTIEGAYNSLITQLIQYKNKAETERNEARSKLAQISNIVYVTMRNNDNDDDDDSYDDMF